jgi:ATP-dependent Clp protease ATP-binding subunit ClpB
MLDTKDPVAVQAATMMALRQKFKPEFLNRIDEFVTFNSLGMEQLVPIVGLELAKVGKRLMDRGLLLSATDGAKEWLAELGHDPTYGARPIKRTIQREVETPIAKGILGGKYPPKSTVLIDARHGDPALTITSVPSTAAGVQPAAGSGSTVKEGLVGAEEGNIMQ